MADNCSGGVCNYGDSGSPSKYPADWQLEATSMGGGGFHLPYSLRRGAYQRNEIANLEAMMREYTGPEGTYIRWMLRNRINKLKILEASKTGSKIRTSDEPPYVTDLGGTHGIRIPENPLPIPDWMQPFVTTTEVAPEEVAEGKRARRSQTQPKTVMGLRPLGAQAELNTEQMMQMAAFLSFQKGWDLQSQSDLGRFWEPYRRESTEMFSQATSQAPKWAIAQQR